MRKAITFGAILLVAGHFVMAAEGPPAQQILKVGGAEYTFQVEGRMDGRTVKLRVGDGLYDYAPAPGGGLEIKGLPAGAPIPSILPEGAYELAVKQGPKVFKDIIFLAMALIVMGVGFLKANISSIVGQLYARNDPRRDPGFTLYYYGINLGAFWAAILCGWLGQNVGWWAGFGLAGVGMLAGLIVFTLGKPLLEGHGEPPRPELLKVKVAGVLRAEWLVYLGGLGGVGVVWVLLQHGATVGYLLGAGSVAVLAYLGWFMAKNCTSVERQRIILALILIAASVLFWTLFEQAGSSMNQFAERNTNLALPLGQSMTAAQTQSFNSDSSSCWRPCSQHFGPGLVSAGWIQTRRSNSASV